MYTKVKHITAYAINKPSEMVSLLNTLSKHDILFIDEIHRLKPAIEEVLYIAMEDWMIDMLMPDGTHIKLPIYPFTLI
jgi:Holliday junction DNA helicase RuvB